MLDMLSRQITDIPADRITGCIEGPQHLLCESEGATNLRPFSIVDIKGCFSMAFQYDHGAMAAFNLAHTQHVIRVILKERPVFKKFVGEAKTASIHHTHHVGATAVGGTRNSGAASG